jgi:FMN phosphatase YigB (HAD superfamily)
MPQKDKRGHILKLPPQSLSMQFNKAGAGAVLVFDLDNTIVDIRSLYKQMEDNYSVFLAAHLNMPLGDARLEVYDMLRQGYYLQDEALRRHNISPAQSSLATFNPSRMCYDALNVPSNLQSILDGIHCDKYILTNAPSFHAEAVLTHLKLRDCFAGVSGTDTFSYMRKPEVACFDSFEKHFNLAGKEVHFFEDTPENLDAAYVHKGWHGHLIEGYRATPAYGPGVICPPHVKSRLNNLSDLTR